MLYNNNNNYHYYYSTDSCNTNTQQNVHGAVIMTNSSRVFTGFTWWM